MPHQVLARKWRPRKFSDVKGQAHVVQALSNALNQNYLHHAYLFTGTRGVGKTTLARIIAKCLNCEQGISATPCEQCSNCKEIDAGRFPDLFEVDAASRTRVEDTRELLDNVQYAPTKGRFKIYLIDEVHMLSGHSFNALLKTLEEPPAHVKFLLATTDPQKLPATVLSRCLQFHLQIMSATQVAEHLAEILTAEKIEFEKDALFAIGKSANGSMRDALSLLDQSIAFGNGKIITREVRAMLGTIDDQTLLQILQGLANQDGNALLAASQHLAHQGMDYARATSQLLELLHHMAVIQAVPSAKDPTWPDELASLASQISPEDVQLYYQIALIGQKDLIYAPTPQSGFEIILLRMLAFAPSETPPNLVKKLPEKAQKVVNNQTDNTAAPREYNDWSELFLALNLTGATRALAELCSLKTLNHNELRLSLAPKHEPLLNKRHVDIIALAVQQRLQLPVKVSIDIEPSDIRATPAGLAEQERVNKKQNAEQALLADSNVQRIMQSFGATLIKDSITPVEGEL